MNITALFHTGHPDALLFNAGQGEIGRSWTIERLFQSVASLSAGLNLNNIKPGERVLILTGNCVETYAFSLALWNIGAVAVPVNPFLGKGALVDIIQDMAPAACFHEYSLGDDLYGILSTYCRLFVSLKSSERTSSPKSLGYSALLKESSMAEPGNFPQHHPALIIHSSGSQGRPKQIQLGHQQLFNYFHYHDLVHRQFAEHPALDVPQQAFISVFHPSHLAAYSITLQGLLMRRPTYLMQGFMPSAYLRLLSSLKCRLSVLVPSMYVALLQEKTALAKYNFSQLSLCGSVGEPTPQALIQRIEQAFQANVFVGYGLTECLPGIAHPWQDLQQGTIVSGSCGRQLFAEVKLMREHEQEGNPGELWLRNPTVHRCYLDEALNEVKFTDDGWFKTGDLFHRDEAGNFFHKGRIDDMFVSNGKNIYPAEIEFTLIQHPAVERLVAAAVIDAEGRCVAAALVQTTQPLADSELLEFFLANGPLHAIPGCIRTTPSLPELGSGKIDRQACQQQLQSIMHDIGSLSSSPGASIQSCLFK